MADGVRIKVTGLYEIQRKMLVLPDKVARNVVRQSLVEGARIIRDEARVRAPVWTGPVSKGHPPPGTLRRSIIVKFVPEQSHNGQTVYYVTVRHGKRYQNQGKSGRLSQDAFYWWWVEFQKAKNPHSRAFMRPAFETKKREAAQAIIDKARAGVMAEAEK